MLDSVGKPLICGNPRTLRVCVRIFRSSLFMTSAGAAASQHPTKQHLTNIAAVRGSRRQRFPRSSNLTRQLHARSPNVAAPRVTTGPFLLTGLAVCATCNGGMTLRTGTSKTGAVLHTAKADDDFVSAKSRPIAVTERWEQRLAFSLDAGWGA
jgi:hypothetical protein